MFDHKGSNRVLVSGGSKGLGLAIASHLNELGYEVVIAARDEKLLDEVTRKKGFTGYASGDVADPNQANKIVASAVESLGGLDALICNVGDGRSVAAGSEVKDDWLKSFNVNFFSATNLVSAAEPYLTKDSGAIVCISSICGTKYVEGAPLTYSVAKAALNSYVKGASVYLAEKRIRINAIAPGNLLFPGSVWDRKLSENPERVRDMLNRKVPLKSFGDPSDVAQLASFLISDVGKFSTGSIFILDGGQSIV